MKETNSNQALLSEIKAKNQDKPITQIYGDIAKETGKSPFTIKSLLSGARRVRAEDCGLLAEALSKYLSRTVSRSEIRPDIFSNETMDQTAA